ncbi:MAG: response regulator [Nannocystaceae bacterium]
MESRPEAQGQGTKSVLLVDDDALTRVLYTRCLKNEDLEIVCVSSAREGLALLDQRKFDLLLLDIIMPEVTGLDMLEQLVTDSPEALPPVIMLSAMQDTAITEKCKSLGAISVLIKPVPAAILRVQVRQVLES